LEYEKKEKENAQRLKAKVERHTVTLKKVRFFCFPLFIFWFTSILEFFFNVLWKNKRKFQIQHLCLKFHVRISSDLFLVFHINFYAF
jgi:hypothetical protein